MPSFTKAPTPTAYRQAQLLARSRAGSLTQQTAQSVVDAIERYATTLSQRLAALPAGTPAAQKAALTAAVAIAKGSAQQLTVELTKAVKANRNLAFKEVFGLWENAGRNAAKTAGVTDALLGAVPTPSTTMAGAFEALGGTPLLKSLSATGHAAGAEVAVILRDGLTANVSPDEIARRLRPYVKGSEVFEKAFPKADERFKALHTSRDRLPKELRGAAGRVRSNSLRIAYSEIHNARAEAELQAFALDPLIAAVDWELSPFRGSQAEPDACDAYAVNDWYGLGPGRYPLDAVPLPPHARDRCERFPVVRPPEEWGQPKPQSLSRKLKPSAAKLGKNAGMLTADAAARVRAIVRTQFQQLEQHSSRKAMQKLLSIGNAASTELVEIAAARQTLLASLQMAATEATVAASAAVTEPMTIGLVTFPQQLDDEALAAAKALISKATGKSATALKALKDAGADTTQLEAKLAAQKSALAAKKAAKKAEPPPPLPAPEPPAPVPVPKPVPAPPTPLAPPIANPLKELTVEQLQEKLKESGVFLLTKQQISANFDSVADALHNALKGDLPSLEHLKFLGANVAKLEKSLGLKLPVPTPAVKPPPAPIAKPKPVVATEPPGPPITAPPPTASAENVLKTKVGDQAGTNPGGFYVGEDGVKRYVKVYADPSQAYGEHLANELYRRIGLTVPESLTFTHQGKVYYASRVIQGAEQQTLAKLGLSADRARKALDGFAADVLVGNWDAPGLGFDNLVDVGGKIARVDNGSAFLFRAQGTRKAPALLDQITEWDGFAPGAGMKNPQYAELFTKGGFSSPEQMGEALVKQIDVIVVLEKHLGGWSQFVKDIVPDMALPDRDAIAKMLKARTALLTKKRDAIMASLTKAAPPAAPMTVPAPATATLFGNDVSTVAVALKKMKPAGTIKVAHMLGIKVSKQAIQESNLGLAFLKKHLVKAAEGDDNSIAVLQYYFKADVTQLQKKLGKVALPANPPTPAAPLAGNVPPHVPAEVLIKPSQVAGVQAASEVQQPLYFNASNTTATALKSTGVDVSKLPAGQLGFHMNAEVQPLGGAQKHVLKMHVVAKKPLTFAASTDAQIEANLAKIIPGWKAATTAAAKRQLLLDKGYDAIVVKDPSSAKVVKVIALKPDAVKIVDEVIPPVKPIVTPQVSSPPSTEKTYSGVPQSSLPVGKPPTPPGYLRDDDALRELDTVHAGAARKLTEAERKAVTYYTGSGYASLNAGLRSGGSLTSSAQTLQRAIDNSPRVRSPVIVYRGLGHNHPYKKLLDKEGFAGLQKLVDEVQHDPGFMSTSTAQSTAVNFGGTGIILELRLPQGAKGFWARLHGSHRAENELILSARQEYRILEVREEQAGHYGNPRIRIIVEVIP